MAEFALKANHAKNPKSIQGLEAFTWSLNPDKTLKVFPKIKRQKELQKH